MLFAIINIALLLVLTAFLAKITLWTIVVLTDEDRILLKNNNIFI